MDQTLEKRFLNVSNSKTFNNIVKTFDLDKKAVLDIGCSYGEFLIHFGPRSIGISIDKNEVESGKARGSDIRLGNIESNSFVLNERFDVIFANNIFEHLYSPHEFLRKITNYMKPDGILILGVPCIPKVSSLLHFRKFRGSLASPHINFFTKKTLVFTVERSGWKISSVRGFRIFNQILDHLLDAVYPHFYVVASNDQNFKYSDKRRKELAGYTK